MQKKDLFDKTTKQGRFYRNLLKTGVLLASMLVAGFCYLQTQKTQNSGLTFEEQVLQSEVFSDRESLDFESQTVDKIENTEQKLTEDKTKFLLYVHVCGQVKNPGVYQLEEGARIFDAVQLAGGLTEEAWEEAINLAKIVTDGEQIRIPDQTEAELFLLEETQTESGLINLNQATKEQLMTLTGIGEARAKDIIAYREEHGAFQTIEDIMKVPGIKEAAFVKIKNEIVVK